MVSRAALFVAVFATVSFASDIYRAAGDKDQTIAELKALDSSVVVPLDDIKLAEAFEGQKNCMVSGVAPAKPRSLSFCHKYNDNACCPPAMDLENNEMFDSMMTLGLSCRIRGDVRKDPLAKLYCMNCDPQQPEYLRPTTYTPLMDGSPTARVDDNNVQSDRAATVLICKDWAIQEFLTGPGTLLGNFDSCGLMVSGPCVDVNGEIIPGRDRYVCGDDLVLPSTMFNVDGDGNPWPADEEWKGIEAFLNLDSLGPPLMDEEVGFLLVDDVACTDAQAAEANPRCKMTAAQLETKFGIGVSQHSECSTNAAFQDSDGNYVCVHTRDERCFNGAAHVASNIFGILALIVATVLLL